MNELTRESEILKSGINTMYNPPVCLGLNSTLANLVPPSETINNITKCLKSSFNNIYGVNLSTAYLSNMGEMVSEFAQSIAKIQAINTSILSSAVKAISDMVSRQTNFVKNNRKFFDRMLFMSIADEIGFPVYMEVDTELQDRLLKSYRENGHQCNIEEMQQIIIDYYNDDYVDQILNGIKNVGIFNEQRVKIISEGIEVYQLGYYGTSASSFAAYISGMIRDIYKEICTMHKFTKEEKKEIIACFDRDFKPDSEKGMLLQIVCSQDGAPLFWYQVVSYFLDNLYASGEKGMDKLPKRHMICHGIQTNHNTREMNLILIMCMDILSELAWRVRRMKEENRQIVIEL